MISQALIQEVRGQYRLSWNGLHGFGHWARVLENGLKLAEKTGANKHVVELFAIFHDACRLNDDWDPNHGSRGADFAAKLRGKYFELNDQEFTALKFACRMHTDGLTKGEVTVLTCWDADRLDLGRVGVKPYKELLCTNAAKETRLYEWANDRACNREIPEFARKDWTHSMSGV
jgi:uncharacterized protein